MAKFCANCGAPLGDDDKVCGQCGTPVEAEAAASVETPVVDNSAALAKPAKSGGNMGKLIAIIAAAVVIIAAIVVLIILNPFGGGGSPEGTIEKFFTAIKNEDSESMLKYISVLDTSSEDYDEEEALDTMDRVIENYLDILEAKVDDEELKSISVEIADKDIKEMKERKFDKFIEELEDESDYDEDVIKSIKKVVQIKKIKLILKGKDGTDGKYTIDDSLYCIQEKGGWKLLMGDGLVSSYF